MYYCMMNPTRGGLRVLVWALAAMALVAAATALDPWAYHHVVWTKVYDTDWGRALRTVGYWPTWIVVSLALWRDGQPAEIAAWRARLLAVSVTLAGLFGEVCKMVLRRERPNAHDGAYVFRPFTDHPFNTSGIGLPSSHAFLAFAGAATLARLFPRTAVIWYLLAIGCGVTRVLAQAHFLSDVVVGALLGVVVATVTAGRNQRPVLAPAASARSDSP
jgi:membrane-associated phospholipid phosphatase